MGWAIISCWSTFWAILLLLKDYLIKSIAACHIIAKGHLLLRTIRPDLSPPVMLFLLWKYLQGRFREQKAEEEVLHCYRVQAGLSAAISAILYACPALDLSGTNVPESDVYRLRCDFEAKPWRWICVGHNILLVF